MNGRDKQHLLDMVDSLLFEVDEQLKIFRNKSTMKLSDSQRKVKTMCDQIINFINL